MSLNAADNKAFVNRLTKIVEANLSNEQFGVNELASKTGLSRSQIHRKLKTICNKSISQFIREIRLEKSRELLGKGDLTVSEIAYKVGFGSPSYFIKSFHDYFGSPPGEYLKQIPDETNIKTNGKNREWSERKSFFKTFKNIKKVLLVFLVAVIISSAIFFVYEKFIYQELALAVLPVDFFAHEAENEYFAYGVQADLIGKLSELKKLRVISQKSTYAYKDSMMSLINIAKKLNVDVVVMPGLIKSGDSLEIVLNVVDVFPEERNIWTKRYKTNLENILQFYSSAVRDIAQRLRINLSEEVDKRLSRTRKVNPESLAAYYRGLNLLGKDNIDLFDEGMKYLIEAIDRDPADPMANAAAAIGYAIKGHNYGKNSKECFIRADFFANRALKLDSTIDEAHTAMAMLHLYQGWEWDKAKKAFTQALRINPNDDIACAHFTWYYQVHGDYENAIYYAKKAVALNPLYIAYTAWLSALYFSAGKYDEAEICAKQVLAKRDSSIYGNIIMGWINLLQGNYNEAIEHTEKLPNWDYWNLYRAYVYLKTGNGDKALSFRNAMEEKAQTRRVADWHRGLMAAIFTDKDEAFKYFNIAIDKKQYQMMYLNWYPFTESIRDDPRYNELLRRMNLPDFKQN